MRSSILAAAVGLALVVASPASAGRIFGDIKMDGKPVPEGMKVRIVAFPARPRSPTRPRPTSSARTS